MDGELSCRVLHLLTTPRILPNSAAEFISGKAAQRDAKCIANNLVYSDAVGIAYTSCDPFPNGGSECISNMDVKRTFLTCVEESELPPEFVKLVRGFKIRGTL